MKNKSHLSVVVSLCLIASLLFGPSAFAQEQVAAQPGAASVPNLIRYSGALKDTSGSALASQTVGVTFSIYKDAEGGVSLWHEVRNITTDASGQYNVLLGSTMTEGVPPELFSDQEQRWLSVQMEGRPEQPRVLLVSVPYAFKAHEAETLGGLPASAFMKAPTGDSTGTASTETGAALTALGAVATVGTTSQTAGTTGKSKAPCPPGTNHIMYWDSTNDICPSVMTQDPTSGNIGIGLPSNVQASEPLDVQGVISTYTWYDINEKRLLSVGNTSPANNASTNLFVGWNSGTANSGDTNNNTFVGRDTGPGNTTGHDNTFSGNQAGNANIGGTEPAGSYNTFTGSAAGLLNTTGFQNTFHGYTAGFGNTTGYENSCFGSAACLHNLTGAQNVGVGVGAGFRNMDGSANVYVGFDSGWGLSGVGSRGSNNTMTGWETGFDNYGSNNVFYGYKAGFSNTTGSSNIAIGAGAGSTAGAGNSNNIYIGNAGTNETGPAIRIGVQGSPHVNQTYIAGIVTNLFPTNSGASVVLVDSTGHLGVSGASLGGPVTGSCSLGVNFLTKWSGTSTVGCTRVWENAAAPYFVGMGPAFQTGTLNSTKQLQVDGDIDILHKNANTHYQITEQTVLSIDGTSNLFTGVGAGTASGSTTGNTFTGYNAGNVNTADGNSFYGFESGAANTTGIQNVFAGYQSGLANTTGYSNIFIGYRAGQANTTESYSTFVGAGAGFSSTVAGNTFLGYSSGSNTTVGYGMVGTGYDAGRSNQDGILNAYFGVNAGFNGSLTNFTHGSYNTYLGNGAGSSTGLVNGSNNIFVGFAAGNAEADVNNSIEIGNTGANHYGNGSIQIGALGSQINQTYIQGIFTYPTPNVNTYVTVDASGHLGVGTPMGGGGGNVNGPSNCGANFLTKWVGGGPNVDCSHVWETNSGTYFVGIGPGAIGAPSRQLEVDGDINVQNAMTEHYQILGKTVLSIDNQLSDENIFLGVGAGTANAGSFGNTFLGHESGFSSVSNQWNTFSGDQAGYSTTGSGNVFNGYQAGYNATTASQSTFIGLEAGYGLTSANGGFDDVFVGYFAGGNNTSGNFNTFLGAQAGNANTSGIQNTYIGFQTGTNNATGSNNVYIDNWGSASESFTTRIGTLETSVYLAGDTVNVSGSTACISGTSQLGICGSSRRFKEQIQDMGDQSNALLNLRPVTFFYRPEFDTGPRALQYGLIAEEVAEIYPNLVTYDPSGKPLSIRYQNLTGMLLNELQKQHKVVTAQQDELASLREQATTQQQQVVGQQQQIDSLKSQLQLQNAAFQERLLRLESLLSTQVASTSTTSVTASAPNGGQ